MILIIAALILFIFTVILLCYMYDSLVQGRIKRFKKQDVEVRRDESPCLYWSSFIVQGILVVIILGIAWRLLKTEDSFSFSLLPKYAPEPLNIITILLALVIVGISLVLFYTSLRCWRRGVITSYYRYAEIHKEKAPVLFWFFIVFFLLGSIYLLLLTLRIVGIV